MKQAFGLRWQHGAANPGRSPWAGKKQALGLKAKAPSPTPRLGSGWRYTRIYIVPINSRCSDALLSRLLKNRAMRFTQPPPTGWGFYGPNRRLTEALVLDPIQSVNRTLLFLKALPTHLKSLLLSLPPLAIGIVASCLMINPSKQVTLPLQTLVNVCWSTVCILFWLSLAPVQELIPV